MLDRGLRRALRPARSSARRARRRERVGGASAAGRRDLRELPTFTIDPPTAQRLRRRDLRRALRRTARSACGCTSPTSPRTCRPARRSTARRYRRGTSVYVPGAVEPMLPEALSNDACSLCPRRGPAGGDGRARARRRARCARTRVPPLADPLRRAARLRRAWTASSPARERAEEPWAAPLAAAREVGRGAAARRASARGALAVESAEPEFAFDARRPRRPGSRRREQTESHRLIEHLMIAANEAVADAARARAGCRRSTACTSGPSRARVERLADQLAVARRPDAAAARAR